MDLFKIFRKKKPIEPEPKPKLMQNEADKIQTLFKKMHRHYQDGSFERAKETEIELKALRSQIRVRPTKLGGGGICCYCKKYQTNLAFHEARCPENYNLMVRGIKG